MQPEIEPSARAEVQPVERHVNLYYGPAAAKRTPGGTFNQSPIFTGIPADRCDEFWPRIEPVIHPAILRSDGRHTAVTTRRAIIDEKMQLWAGFSDATMSRCIFAVVTETQSYPTGLAEIEIVFCAGDVLPDNLPCLDVIERWALSIGHNDAQIIGRRGWTRALKERGYEEVAIVLRKRLAS